MTARAAACVVLAVALQAQSPVALLLEALEGALERGERAAVAGMVHYPVVVSIEGIRVPFPDVQALVARYDEIFTRELREAVARGPANVVETPDGFVLGANILSMKTIGGQLKIVAITVPPADAAASATASPPASVPRGREPRRIGIRGGPRPTRFAGSLPAGAVDTYLVFVPQGQLLDVRLERVRGEAVVRVVNAATGASLNPRVARGALVVAGRAPSSADYRIEVQRTSAGELALPYKLAVSMR
jgi:hypothetical protein